MNYLFEFLRFPDFLKFPGIISRPENFLDKTKISRNFLNFGRNGYTVPRNLFTET